MLYGNWRHQIIGENGRMSMRINNTLLEGKYVLVCTSVSSMSVQEVRVLEDKYNEEMALHMRDELQDRSAEKNMLWAVLYVDKASYIG